METAEVARIFQASGTAPTASLSGEPPFSTRPELIGTFGMVTSSHWLASASGMAILEKGGNAFDAAVAVSLALHVIEPTMCGLGGEAPMILCDGKTDKVHVISGQGTAPGLASIAAYRDLGLDIVPGAGLLPAVVPGAFDGLMTLLRDWGTMSVRDVLAPATDYARNGYPISGRVCATIAGLKELFTDHWPSSGAVYLPNGNVPAARSRFCNPTLADTFERLVKEAEAVGGNREAQIKAAQDAYYRGFVADAIDDFCRNNEFLDTSGERHGGFMRGDDLAGFETSIEAPLSVEYGEFTVFKMGPWSQGPVLLQQLSMLKNFDLGAMDPNGAEFVHHVAEATKLAFADREKFYGDPKFVDVPMERLLSDAYGRERAALIAHEASGDIRPGTIPGYGGPVVYGFPDGSRVSLNDDGGTAPVGLSRAVAIATGDTVHLDIADREGNMISVTPSGEWLRSSPAIPALGFQLSNRGQIFTLPRRYEWAAWSSAPSSPANAPGPHSAPVLQIVAVNLIWPSARRARTARTNGRCSSFFVMLITGKICKQPSTRPLSTPIISRVPFIQNKQNCARSAWRDGFRRKRWRTSNLVVTKWIKARIGRKAA